MTVVLGVAALLQTAPDWMTQPGFLLAFLLALTAAAVAILWDEFWGPERTNSNGANDRTTFRAQEDRGR